jgi:hypothetical protein
VIFMPSNAQLPPRHLSSFKPRCWWRPVWFRWVILLLEPNLTTTPHINSLMRGIFGNELRMAPRSTPYFSRDPHTSQGQPRSRPRSCSRSSTCPPCKYVINMARVVNVWCVHMSGGRMFERMVG